MVPHFILVVLSPWHMYRDACLHHGLQVGDKSVLIIMLIFDPVRVSQRHVFY